MISRWNFNRIDAGLLRVDACLFLVNFNEHNNILGMLHVISRKSRLMLVITSQLILISHGLGRQAIYSKYGIRNQRLSDQQ